MRRDGNDGDDRSSLLAGFVGPVVPEYAISSGGVVLSIGLEDLLASCSGERSELVRTKAGMIRVYFQITESLANLREDP